MVAPGVGVEGATLRPDRDRGETKDEAEDEAEETETEVQEA